MMSRHPASEQKALQVVDEWITAMNNRDWEAFVSMLNYPHVRVASGTVSVWNSPSELIESMRQSRGKRLQANWHHSVFDSKEFIHSFDDKVHLAVQFTRYDKEGNKIATYPSLYVVTCVDGHWGIQVRSSAAP